MFRCSCNQSVCQQLHWIIINSDRQIFSTCGEVTYIKMSDKVPLPINIISKHMHIFKVFVFDFVQGAAIFYAFIEFKELAAAQAAQTLRYLYTLRSLYLMFLFVFYSSLKWFISYSLCISGTMLVDRPLKVGKANNPIIKVQRNLSQKAWDEKGRAGRA